MALVSYTDYLFFRDFSTGKLKENTFLQRKNVYYHITNGYWRLQKLQKLYKMVLSITNKYLFP